MSSHATGSPAGAATAPHRSRSSSSGQTARLTIGWRTDDRPPGLRIHLDRYGPLPRSRRPGALIEAVTEAGLTGRGGAAFPTGVKMRAVASGRGPAVVVANGMESEPASEKDKALLRRAPHLVLDGAVAAAAGVAADIVHLCLPRHDRSLIAMVDQAVAERERAGLDHVRISISAVPHYYVSSEESALVQWLNGGEAKPAAVPPRPFEKGVGRRPTLVDNVETLAHVGLIARFGPGWFREAGLPDAPGTMLTTIAGAVSLPGVYEVEVGTPIGDLLAMCEASGDADSILIGGYFGTWHDVSRVAGLPLAPPRLRGIGASPGAGVLFLLPGTSCGLAESARVLGWLASQGAGQCGPCMFGLPAIADDFAQLAARRPRGPVIDRLERRLATVNGRGACRHPDGAVRLARSALAAFSADVRAHASGRACVSVGRDRPPRPVLPIPQPSGEQVWR